MPAIRGKDFGVRLTELWGWKGCRSINIHIPVDGIVMISAEFYATQEQADGTMIALRDYVLMDVTEK